MPTNNQILAKPQFASDRSRFAPSRKRHINVEAALAADYAFLYEDLQAREAYVLQAERRDRDKEMVGVLYRQYYR